MIAKARRRGQYPDREAIKKELGDVLWQLSAVADDFGLTLDDVGVCNLSKLADRAVRGVVDGSGDER